MSVWIVLTHVNGLSWFKEGRTSVDYDRQQAEMMILTRVCELICANRWLNVREISTEAGISYSKCQTINRRSEHAMHFCEIRSSCPHLRAKGTRSVWRHWSPSRGKNRSELHGKHYHRWLDWDWPLVSKGQRHCNPARGVCLHHDNAFSHCLLSSGFLKQIMSVLRVTGHPTPDMADFQLFPKVKMALKGKRFDNTDTIKENTTNRLSSIAKDSLKKNVCNSGRTTGIKYTVSEGACFEGDWVFVSASTKGDFYWIILGTYWSRLVWGRVAIVSCVNTEV